MLAGSIIMPAFLMSFLQTDKNMLVGYRTPWSMKSEHTWNFAQKHSAKMLRYSAAVSIVVQLSSIFIFEKETSMIITVIVLTLSIFVAMFLTERALRKHFHKDGSPKSEAVQDLV